MKPLLHIAPLIQPTTNASLLLEQLTNIHASILYSAQWKGKCSYVHTSSQLSTYMLLLDIQDVVVGNESPASLLYLTWFETASVPHSRSQRNMP